MYMFICTKQIYYVSYRYRLKN